MNRKVLKKVTPHLLPGETVEFECKGSLAPVDTSYRARNVVAGVAAVGVAAVTGFGMAHYKMPRQFFLVLTDRRLLFLDMDMAYATPMDTVSFILPRHGLQAAAAGSGKIALADPNGNHIGMLKFALAFRGGGKKLLALLTQDAGA